VASGCAAVARAPHGALTSDVIYPLSPIQSLHDYLDEVLELTSSTKTARYDIRGWMTVEREPGCESHEGSPSGLLGEAAATALALLSHGQARIEPIATNDVDGSLRRNRAIVAAWVADNAEKRH